MHENRPLSEKAQDVLDAVGLTWEKLEGKRLLEIGSGLAVLGQVAKEKGVDVVSLEKNPEMWGEDGEVPKNIEYIVGDAEKIPLEDNSVEIVISKAAPPTISKTKEEVTNVIDEAMRILKPGGVFRFGPARMSYLGEVPLLTDKEEETFTSAQRAERVLDKSLEVLQELYPSIQRINDEHGIGIFELHKPSEEH